MRECENCGSDLKGSSYTLTWEDGDNPCGYVTCRNCGHKNYDEDDDD